MSKRNKTQRIVVQKPEMGVEIATTDVAQWISHLDYLPNPDRILRSQGGSIGIYRQFIDEHLDAVRDKRVRAVTSRPWSIDGGAADKRAKTIEDHLWNLGLRHTIGLMMEAIGFGYAVHEIIWDVVDGIVLPIAIKDKPQEWFRFSDDDALLLMDKSGKTQQLPGRKFLVTRHGASASNPYGKAVYSRCFWPMMFKRGGLKFWMIFTERFGTPKTIGKVPGSSSQSERNEVLKMLSGLVRDAVAVIPDTGSVELLESKTTGSQPHPEIVRWADRAISKAWLSETLTTEQTDEGGTRALGEVHNDVRKELTMDDAVMVEETMNQLIRWIYEINWPQEKYIPWFAIQLPEDLQTGRITRDKGLYALGLRFNRTYFVDTYGISPQHIDRVDSGDTKQATGTAFAENPDDERPVNGDDGAIALAVNTAKIPVFDPLRKLVESADSLEAVRDGLLGVYAEMPADNIAEELEQAFIAADLAGRYDILDKAGLLK